MQKDKGKYCGGNGNPDVPVRWGGGGHRKTKKNIPRRPARPKPISVTADAEAADTPQKNNFDIAPAAA